MEAEILLNVSFFHNADPHDNLATPIPQRFTGNSRAKNAGSTVPEDTDDNLVSTLSSETVELKNANTAVSGDAHDNLATTIPRLFLR